MQKSSANPLPSLSVRIDLDAKGRMPVRAWWARHYDAPMSLRRN